MNINYIIINLNNNKLHNINLINIICYLYSNKYFKTYVIDGEIIYPIILIDNNDFYKQNVDMNLIKFLDKLLTLKIINDVNCIPNLRSDFIKKYFVYDINSEDEYIILNSCFLQFILKKFNKNSYFSTNISKINNNEQLEDTNKIFKLAFIDTFDNLLKYLKGNLELDNEYVTNRLNNVIDVKNLKNIINNFSENINKHIFIKKYSNIVGKYCFNKINLIDNKFNQKLFFLLLERNKPFTIIRYGDGELMNIYYSKCNRYNKKRNKDKCKYNDELGKYLLDYMSDDKLINNCNLFLLIQYHQFIYDNDFNDSFLDKIKNKIKFYKNSGFFVDLLVNELNNKSDFYSKFIKYVNTKDVLYLGPNYADDSELNPIKYKYFIKLLSKDCFTEFKDILDKVDKYACEINCVICQGGFGVKPVMFEIFKKYPNVWIFDIGSSIDYFFNKKSRKYLKNISKSIPVENVKNNI